MFVLPCKERPSAPPRHTGLNEGPSPKGTPSWTRPPGTDLLEQFSSSVAGSEVRSCRLLDLPVPRLPLGIQAQTCSPCPLQCISLLRSPTPSHHQPPVLTTLILGIPADLPAQVLTGAGHSDLHRALGTILDTAPPVYARATQQSRPNTS